MNYTEITISPKIKKTKFDHPSLKYKVEESHEDGEWTRRGTLLHVYEVDGFFVCMGAFNQRPLMVLPNEMHTLVRRLKAVTGCMNVIEKR